MDKRAGIVWLTNMAAPYRRPLWTYIGQHAELTTLLLESDRNILRSGRRGGDWLRRSGVGDDNYQLAEIPTLRIGRGERLFYVSLAQLHARMAAVDAVLLGGWDSPAYWQMWIAARIRGATVVGFYESTTATQHHVRGPIAKARSFFFRRLDAIVVPGPAAERSLKNMGVDPSRIRVGFNAVDVQRFASFNRAVASAGTDADTGAGHRYIFVGQMIPRKNISNLIKAFRERRNPGDTLTVVGSGELREQLALEVASLGLEGVIVFLDSIPNDQLPALLAQHHTLVLPSTEEVWGLVVNEALATGLHVVVSRRAGVAESVASMRGVYLVDPDSKSIGGGLTSSRHSWRGWIREPEILRHTPERFAEVFLEALGVCSSSPERVAPSESR